MQMKGVKNQTGATMRGWIYLIDYPRSILNPISGALPTNEVVRNLVRIMQAHAASPIAESIRLEDKYGRHPIAVVIYPDHTLVVDTAAQ